MHWNTPELVDFLEKTSGERPKDEELGHWAYFIIDAEEHRYTTFYFNTKTSQIILEDEVKPYEPYLLDADGKRASGAKSADIKR